MVGMSSWLFHGGDWLLTVPWWGRVTDCSMVGTGSWRFHGADEFLTVPWCWRVPDGSKALMGSWRFHDGDGFLTVPWWWRVYDGSMVVTGSWLDMPDGVQKCNEWLHRHGGCLACWRFQGCKLESRLWLSCTDLYYARGAQGDCPWGLMCDQSSGSTFSDAIVRSWLWRTATRSSPLGCFSRLLQVVANWPHILW